MIKARCNPFASDRVQSILYKQSHQEWQELLSKFKTLGYRGALVGPRGAGKTTLLEEIAKRSSLFNLEPVFWRQNYRQIQPSYKDIKVFFTKCSSQSLVCIDSAELLNWIPWSIIKIFSKKVGGVLITAHREGLLPTLKYCKTSPALLETILVELLSEDYRFSKEQVVKLFYRHNGNIRDALIECYSSCVLAK